jgi:hypothetical protein
LVPVDYVPYAASRSLPVKMIAKHIHDKEHMSYHRGTVTKSQLFLVELF